MNRQDIQKAFDDLKSEQDHVKVVIDGIEAQKMEAVKGLAEIEEKLPGFLADLALGKISKSEVVKIKKKRSDLDEIIKDHPLVMEGLKRVQAKLSRQAEVIRRPERKLNVYDEMKEKIRSSRDSRFVEQWKMELLDLARDADLNCLADAKRFLEGLK